MTGNLAVIVTLMFQAKQQQQLQNERKANSSPWKAGQMLNKTMCTTTDGIISKQHNNAIIPKASLKSVNASSGVNF